MVNKYLTEALEKLDIWNSDMVKQIKLYDGSLKEIAEIPESIKELFKETFEISMASLIRCAAQRMKWIDQSASTNIFMNTKSGKDMSDMYFLAWESGLKTTYYFRSLAASQITKATVDETTDQIGQDGINACKINDPACEACE